LSHGRYNTVSAKIQNGPLKGWEAVNCVIVDTHKQNAKRLKREVEEKVEAGTVQ